MTAQMHRENLIIALSMAIAEQEKIDKWAGLKGDSIICKGWKQVREVLQKGGNIDFFEIKK